MIYHFGIFSQTMRELLRVPDSNNPDAAIRKLRHEFQRKIELKLDEFQMWLGTVWLAKLRSFVESHARLPGQSKSSRTDFCRNLWYNALRSANGSWEDASGQSGFTPGLRGEDVLKVCPAPLKSGLNR